VLRNVTIQTVITSYMLAQTQKARTGAGLWSAWRSADIMGLGAQIDN